MTSALACAGFRRYLPSSAYDPFPEVGSHLLRVSMVSHPCDWLGRYYLSRWTLSSNVTTPSFEVAFAKFILDYLDVYPGRVGKKFESYKADLFIRVEDLPEAFYEFMNSLRVPRSLYEHLIKKPDFQNGLPKWDPELRRRVCQAEKKMLEDFDYHC